MRTFAAAGTTLIILISFASFSFSATAQYYQTLGHPASSVGPGTFSGSTSDAWKFPGNVWTPNICDETGLCKDVTTLGSGGGTCACPWATQSPGLFYSGSAGVSGDLWANRICENGGSSCVSIDAIGTGGGTCSCPWLAQSPGTYYSGSAGVGGNAQIAGDVIANRICDTETPTTCMDVKGLGGGGTCTCPDIWGTATGGIYYNSGNVAIGSATPSSTYKLKVTGGEDVDKLAANRLIVGASSMPDPGSYNALVAGRLAIGKTSAPASELDVAGTIRAQQICDETGLNCKLISTGWSSGGTSQWTGTTSIYYNGNVGIGVTSAPSDRLVVAGGRAEFQATTDATGSAGTGVIEVADALRIDGDEIITNTNAPLYLQRDNNGALNVDSGTLFVDASTNRVGIGTTSPASLLEVMGTTGAVGRFYSTSSGAFAGTWFINGAYAYSTNIGTDNKFHITGNVNSPSTLVTVDSTGNVGIGTTNPLSRLSAGGDGVANTGVYGRGGSYGVYGVGSDTLGVGVAGFSNMWHGIEGRSTSNMGVYGEGTGGVYGKSIDGKPGYGVYGYSDYSLSGYGVRGYGGTYDFYATGPGTNYGPFTGAHEVKLSGDFPGKFKAGTIVSLTGENEMREHEGEVSISSTLPTVKVSDVAYDNKAVGAVVGITVLPEDHWYFNLSEAGDRFAVVNALGDGRVLVTNINGNIKAGDYITSSEIPGYGMKQDDDLLHSYTLGKANEDVDWKNVKETVRHNGKEYKVYLIGVFYTSG